MKTKLKGRHFETNEMIEAVSQAVLITLTEHDFQDAFKKLQKPWEWCIRAEGATLGVMVDTMRKASF
jgi:hypothetical protein